EARDRLLPARPARLGQGPGRRVGSARGLLRPRPARRAQQQAPVQAHDRVVELLPQAIAAERTLADARRAAADAYAPVRLPLGLDVDGDLVHLDAGAAAHVGVLRRVHRVECLVALAQLLL